MCYFDLPTGQARLTTDASKAALPFFLKHGFQVQHENRIRRNGVKLINYRVVYDLSQDF
ncbi:hypothetical protein [Neisseria wadsworthii]|uniref:N-acetyltransferase domain-containing protein n=1 Tax=Neisseria wadsworthii 9715 TaxID=1030841 RepID=G4CSM1_9NEIS|nr:hypothetical protein [Neisseria wadsworthii]EGZ44577.1 hypothetical protein HMPREF9370_2103 [Neisseria wadsworthii 9715]QMT35722.1 hypothetical protein H3L96_00095 [Neisseria wadsworthii]